MSTLGSVDLTVHIYQFSTQMGNIYTGVLVSYLHKAAVTNYHKVSGLEECVITFIQFWSQNSNISFESNFHSKQNIMACL